MIKVQNDVSKDKKNPLAVVYQDKQVHDLLLKKGIDIGRHAHPDVVLAMANDLKEVKPNTIGIERIDGCQIRNKRLLPDENLKKLVKMYYYPNYAVNNLSCIAGRVFSRFLTEDREPQNDHVNKEDFEKIVLGCNFLHYKRHDTIDRYVHNTNWNKQKKDIDVFFAGTTDYNGDSALGELVTQHRKNAVRAIKGLKRSINTYTESKRELNASSYMHYMSRAKITVSPWGWGESCYRDYEGLLCQMDVIKPRGYQIGSQADIYSDTVFYCKPDFSDLAEVIEGCLETFEERKMHREETQNRLLEWRTPEAVAGIIEHIIRGVV